MGFPNRPSFRQLEYLLAVSELRHFGRAAQRCGVSQPALSAQIQKLEEILGVPLLQRGSGGVVLTPAGLQACEMARQLLEGVESLQEDMRRFQDPRSGTLRLGAIPTVAPYLLPPALPRLREVFPDLHLEVREDKTLSLLEALRQGELDLCLLALDLDMDFGDLREIPLMEDPFFCLLPEGHPLASKDSIQEGDLNAAEFLLLEEGHCLRDQALRLCSSLGARELPNLRATSLLTLVSMVAMGLGLTLIPQMAISREVRPEDPLVLRPFEGGRFGRRIGFLHRPDTGRRAFFEGLREFFSETP